MTAAPSGARNESPARRGRSWTLPLYVAVIAISGIVVWRVLAGGSDGASIGPEPSDFVVNPAVSAYWRDDGRLLVARSRELLPGIAEDLSDGQTCVPSSLFPAVRCPDIPGELEESAATLEALIADARATSPPADSTASEWLRLQLVGWEELLVRLRLFAEIGRDGYDEQRWDEAFAVYAESDAFTQSERQLARMLAQVAPEDLAPR